MTYIVKMHSENTNNIYIYDVKSTKLQLLFKIFWKCGLEKY